MISVFCEMAGQSLTRICVECGWQEIPDGEPNKLFCPECDGEEFEERENE